MPQGMDLSQIEIKPDSLYGSLLYGGDCVPARSLMVISPQAYAIGENGGMPITEHYRKKVIDHLHWYGDGHPWGAQSIEVLEFALVETRVKVSCDRRQPRIDSWYKRNGREQFR